MSGRAAPPALAGGACCTLVVWHAVPPSYLPDLGSGERRQGEAKELRRPSDFAARPLDLAAGICRLVQGDGETAEKGKYVSCLAVEINRGRQS